MPFYTARFQDLDAFVTLLNSTFHSLHQKISWSLFLWTKKNVLILFDRLDEMRHHLDALIELVSSLRKKESQYRDAFSRRCQDLRKAETEVLICSYNILVLVCF